MPHIRSFSLFLIFMICGNAVHAQQYIQSQLDRADSLKTELATLTIQEQKGLTGAKLYTELGGTYRNLKNFPVSLEYYHQAEQIALIDESKTDHLSLIYDGLSSVHYRMGDLEESLKYIRLAQEYSEGLAVDIPLVNAYIQRGAVLAQMEEFEEAEFAYRKGVRLAEELGNSSYIGSAYLNLASMYSRIDQPDSFFVLIDKSEKAFLVKNDTIDLVFVDMEIAWMHFSLDAYERSLQALDRSYQLCQSAEPPYTCRNYDITRSYAFEGLNMLDSAQHYVRKSIESALKVDDYIQLQDGYVQLSDLQVRESDFEAALASYKIATTYQDSTFSQNLENSLATERANLNLEAEQEAREKAELEARLLSSQNQLYLAIGSGLLLLLLIGGYLFRQLSRARLQLSDNNEELKALNQTKDKFFGLIAHDIRSPVIAMGSLGDQIRLYQQQQKPARLLRLADLLEQTSGRLSNLLDNLLQWALLQSKMIPYQPEKFEVGALIQESLELYREPADLKQIQLSFQQLSPVYSYADPKAIQTIVRNLVSNALKFTSEGGKVELNYSQVKDQIKISVADTGTGMTDQQLVQIFGLQQKSRTGTQGEKGTGLGLVLCQELVKLNKGSIQATSQEGIGSQFSIEIPAAA